MRKILSAFCLLAFAISAAAQQPAASLPDAPGWTRAEAVKPGAKIHVSAKPSSASCHFKSADDGGLTCVGDDATKPLIFQRADVRKITSSRRGWSTLIGLGIGVGVGAILGAATGDDCSGPKFICFSHGEVAALFAIPLGAVGAIVGVATDFDRKTIYKAR